MSDIIQLLPDSVANQIAAGEVIQRPANVVKELVENSVDAGATEIDVVIVDAGKTSIQVIDNGKGMSETDARLAFEKHATSKIRKADDLFALYTMGFRGEALPSIAACAQVELITREAESDFGICLNLADSKIVDSHPCAASVGSRFTVNNLFYGVPARRKFLNGNDYERKHIIETFIRIALVYPEVHFTLHSDGHELYNLKPGNSIQRITGIVDNKTSQQLLAVSADTSICNIRGYVGKPESAKKKCRYQYFFVNGRYMRHPGFSNTVQSVFERLVPEGCKVPFFIYIDINPADIDVNISPTKEQIKFENESAMYELLRAAINDAVANYKLIPTIDFDTEGCPEIPVFGNSEVVKPQFSETSNPHYNPFKSVGTSRAAATPDWEKLYSASGRGTVAPVSKPDDFFGSLIDAQQSVDEGRSGTSLQCRGQYIITTVNSGILYVNQHRAHVRVLYEQYMRQVQEHKPVSQRMLFPEAVAFNTPDEAQLDMVVMEMEKLGFELTSLGAGNFAVNSVPAGLEGIDVPSLVQDLVSDVMSVGTSVGEQMNHTLALGLARKAAIPDGQVLGNEEMEDLLDRLFKCSNSKLTPDGKPVYVVVAYSDIEQKFR